MENYAPLKWFHSKVTNVTYISHVSLAKACHMAMLNFKDSGNPNPRLCLEVENQKDWWTALLILQHYMGRHFVEIIWHFAYDRHIVV